MSKLLTKNYKKNSTISKKKWFTLNGVHMENFSKTPATKQQKTEIVEKKYALKTR